MSMIYTDEAVSDYMMDMEAPGLVDSGMGDVWDLFRKLGTSLGLRDPINHYEPGKTLLEVWAKYRPAPEYYAAQIRSLRSATEAKRLMPQIPPLTSIRNRLAPAFAAGAKVGARDRDRLAELVQGVRDLRKDLNAAERQYGTFGNVTDKVMPVAVKKEEAEIPVVPIVIALGVGLLLLKGVF